MKLIAVCFGFAALASWAGLATAQTPGRLDQSFGNSGKVITSFGSSSSDFAYAVAIQPDGKILSGGEAGGNSDFALSRHNSDGTLDTAFGTGGKVVTPVGSFIDRAFAIAIQPDGKIVAVGYALGTFADFALVRYHANGTLDTSFGAGGKVTTAIGASDDVAVAVEIQSDGKIVAAGFSYGVNEDFALARYNTDGSLDISFGAGGKVVTPIRSGSDFLRAIKIQSDGKIVAVGSSASGVNINPDFALVRYNTDGSFDNSFGTGGKVVTLIGNSTAYAAGIQPDGKIIVAGESGSPNPDFALARYHGDGSLDNSFGTNGVVATPFGDTSSDSGRALVIQSNAKIVVVGFTFRNADTGNDFALAAYNIDGSLDISFGSLGKVVTPIGNSQDTAYGAAIQPDGNIVAAGFSLGTDADFALVRYIGDARGTPFDFDDDGRADISIFRPSVGDWYVQRSHAGLFGVRFGLSTDQIVPADYDGDGKTDVAVYRPSDGIWFVVNSSNQTVSYHVFGLTQDIPVPGDFDGDGRADISVFRPSDGTWYRMNSSNGSFFGRQFGASGDKPVVGDFDGDGKADLALFRPSIGTWFQIRSQNDSFFGEQFGIGSDVIVPADYDGDRKTDLAVYRASNGFWYIKPSLTGAITQTPFGIATDTPAPADFDGDGRADICVFRPSEGQWYRLNSSTGMFNAFPFGFAGDRPTQSAFSN